MHLFYQYCPYATIILDLSPGSPNGRSFKTLFYFDVKIQTVTMFLVVMCDESKRGIQKYNMSH